LVAGLISAPTLGCTRSPNCIARDREFRTKEVKLKRFCDGGGVELHLGLKKGLSGKPVQSKIAYNSIFMTLSRWNPYLVLKVS